MAIIACSGKAGSGKNTFASILQWVVNPQYSKPSYFNYDYIVTERGKKDINTISTWKQVAFATKLKRMASIILGVPIEKFEDQEYKASYLSSEWDVWRIRFANGKQYGKNFSTGEEAIKWEAAERYDLQWQRTRITTITREKVTIREFLISLGLKCRNIHKNFWINGLFSDYKPTNLNKDGYLEYNNGKTLVVPNPQMFPEELIYPSWIVTDCRFLNEAKAIKDRGGIIVRINRPDNPYPSINSESETQLDNYSFDHVVENKSLEGLVESAKKILNEFN